MGSGVTSTTSVSFGAAWDDDDDITKKDMKRLVRARAKLAPSGNDWLVDDAFDAGMSAAEILAQSSEGEQGAEVLWNYIYGNKRAEDYRTWGSSIMSDL